MRIMKILVLGAVIALFSLKGFSQETLFDPPWNDPLPAAVNFTIEGIDNVPDIYGDVTDPQLVVFFAGNQYMVVDQLLEAFKKTYPKYKRVLAETLPPGILAKQMKGGSLTIGNMRLSYKPDIYTAGKGRIEENKALFSETVPYAKNSLAIMVAPGNPKEVSSLKDLGKPGIKVSMPNPAWEGIARQIEQAYVLAGGEQLQNTIMKQKVVDGTTVLTKIHHRQTPLNILYGRADAGPVWITEALYHQKIHHTGTVRIPDDQNMEAIYFAGLLKDAPHKKAAKDFLAFMKSKEAQDIYRSFGFQLP